MRTCSLLLCSASLLFLSACDEGAAEPPVHPTPGGLHDAGSSPSAAGASGAAQASGSSSTQGQDAAASASSQDGGASGATAGNAQDAGAGRSDAGSATDPGLDFPDGISWSTDEFEIPAGKERYLCFASNLEQDLVVNAFSAKGQAFVHHLIFSRSRANDKLGFEECDIAFRTGWEPLFISGAGPAKLELPNDAGHKLAKGSKLVVQMHLLNTADQPVKGKVVINMRRSSHPSPRPVSSYILGTAAVNLPPMQNTELKGECTMREAVHLIAGFPHMHLLGTGLRVETGPAGSMREIFKRDPYSFDSQSIQPLDVELKAGDVTRVSCKYNNPYTEAIGYGESTKNEMCYFIGFALDRSAQGACLGKLPPL